MSEVREYWSGDYRTFGGALDLVLWQGYWNPIYYFCYHVLTPPPCCTFSWGMLLDQTWCRDAKGQGCGSHVNQWFQLGELRPYQELFESKQSTLPTVSTKSAASLLRRVVVLPNASFPSTVPLWRNDIFFFSMFPENFVISVEVLAKRCSWLRTAATSFPMAHPNIGVYYRN